MSEDTQARRFLVSGQVQGVGFRSFVQHVAGKIGVCGYVRNRRDGSVEAYAIGTPKQLRDFRAAIVKGPLMSYVAGVNEEPDAFDPRYAHDFSIEMTV